jgi:Protein of unknown function (DUF3489)
MTKKASSADATGKPARARKAAQGRTRAPRADRAPDTADATPDATVAPRTRAGSKQAKLIEMLRQPDGVTVDEIVAAFKWQPHTVRGAIAGALKKKLGLKVDSEKVEGRGRVYRITD